MRVGIQEKRLVFRIAAGVSAAYTFEPTRAMIGGFLDTDFGVLPFSLMTVCGALTGIFIWGHYKRWW